MNIKTILGVIVVITLTLSVSFSMARYQAMVETKMDTMNNRINEIPEAFGNWQRIKTEPLPDYAAEQLKVKNAEVWYYKNSLTEDVVIVFVIVGPTGRLAVHTPEICISGAEVAQVFPRTQIEIPVTKANGDVVENHFWKVRIGQRLTDDYERLFYYAMGTGHQWFASENPRFEFSRYPIMVKIQVESIISTKDQSQEDVIFRFLQEFIPEIGQAFADTEL